MHCCTEKIIPKKDIFRINLVYIFAETSISLQKIDTFKPFLILDNQDLIVIANEYNIIVTKTSWKEYS